MGHSTPAFFQGTCSSIIDIRVNCKLKVSANSSMVMKFKKPFWVEKRSNIFCEGNASTYSVALDYKEHRINDKRNNTRIKNTMSPQVLNNAPGDN